ncbi:hypothetical protein IAU59_004350 [Kwoniella sp. CBS 9459]
MHFTLLIPLLIGSLWCAPTVALSVPANALYTVPVGCVSGKFFHDHIISGDGSLTRQPDRKNCKEQCQVTGFKYAYLRKESRKCFCTSSDRLAPSAKQMVDGIDREGRCKDTDASIDYFQSQYNFDLCYDKVPGSTSRKKLVSSHEKCFDYCHGSGSDNDSWVVSVIPQKKEGKYLCKCFTSNALGKGKHNCGPSDAFRYTTWY